jgi:tetratricopeptide (TPR) repeat protein
MESSSIQTGKHTEGTRETTGLFTGRSRRSFFLTILFLLALPFLFPYPPCSSWAAERVTRKPSPQRDVVITDANLSGQFARAEELFKKGQHDGALKIYVRISDYAKEVLESVRIIQGAYEKAASDPSISQQDKEALFVKLKRISQLTARYEPIRLNSLYKAGYIQAKKGDVDRARKYLGEVMTTTPYTGQKDSLWMKAKTLLLDLHNLEGEF